ncbi:MAG: plasmid mobilization relaxosome protein MobC [Clostridiales bacterium]|nr:plasmid mobilization relaxosome protein MobC [Clostridiales bacterium]MBS5877825.1 plasmid mobilization relaxosome protein MobC [Clostridiales bacterium]
MNRVIKKNFRITEKEYVLIKEKMKTVGITSESAYFRKMAIDGYCVDVSNLDLSRLYTEISRCGNNLNQYAKHANTTGAVYREEIQEIREDFSKVLSAINDVALLLKIK